MTGLNEEEMDAYCDAWEKQHERDIAWLKECGWIEHPPADPTKESSTWTHPLHGDRVYTWLHSEIVDTAEMDLVRELGWFSVAQHTFHPNYHGCNGDYSHLEYEEDTQHGYNDPSRKGKPIIWGRYVHPVSGKIYTYLEAAEIARYYHNSEKEWLADGNKPSGWHEQVQALLGDRKLNKDNVLWLKFGPRNAPDDMENVYSLMRID